MKRTRLANCCTPQNARRFGYFRRKSDGRTIQRYCCKTCNMYFSNATFDPAYYQKKRHLNHPCMMALASAVSIKRTALLLCIHPVTVARKLRYLSLQLGLKNDRDTSILEGVEGIQFDELQTIEHSKCKPLSVAMAVTLKTRKIIGFRVSVMPATGYLAAISRRKYGYRPDHRRKNMKDLFNEMHTKLPPTITIQSDECSYYAGIVKYYFPKAIYHQFKGKKSSVSGQGELKKIIKDPLFTINHTFAMLRANINRLIRKTWCTTKHISRLIDHLRIYIWVHNNTLTAKSAAI